MNLNARVDVNCEWMEGLKKNRTPMLHPKAGATKISGADKVDRKVKLNTKFVSSFHKLKFCIYKQ